MSQENVEIVRRSIDAYNRGDLDAVRGLNHPDIEVDWSASRGLAAQVYRGWDEVKAFYRDFLEVFDIMIEPERFIESGELVVVPNTSRNRGRDGIETVARSALVFEVRGGLISRMCLYQETREALEAAGLRE
jgi:ketosteroid isomerase-like protein